MHLHLRGNFTLEHWRHDKLVGLYPCKNSTTDEGKIRFLNVGFFGTQQVTSWWMGLIDSVGYTALASTDVYRNINKVSNGWREFTTYTDTNNGDSATTRPIWTPNSASGQSITNTTKSLFAITTSGIVKGLFIVGGSPNAQIKANHIASNSVLWATGLFDTGDCTVSNGDNLRVIYSINA